MHRIEASELIELEQAEGMAFKPLKLTSTRFSQPLSRKPPRSPNQALADEIHQLWAIPFPRLMKLITSKGPQCIREVFEEVKKNPNAKNPPALFLWTTNRIKVELRDVE